MNGSIVVKSAVSEIFLVPPVNMADSIQPAELKAYLERFFPRYTFTVNNRTAAFQKDEDFVLIPMAGIAGTGPGCGMFRPVPEAEWAQMYDALRSFRPTHEVLN